MEFLAVMNTDAAEKLEDGTEITLGFSVPFGAALDARKAFEDGQVVSGRVLGRLNRKQARVGDGYIVLDDGADVGAWLKARGVAVPKGVDTDVVADVLAWVNDEVVKASSKESSRKGAKAQSKKKEDADTEAVAPVVAVKE